MSVNHEPEIVMIRKALMSIPFMLAASLSACSTFAPITSAPLASSDNRTYERNTSPGREVRIFIYTRYNEDCSPAGDPHIVLRSAPAHGSVTFRPETAVVNHSRFGPVCIGKTLPGIAVWYTPNAAYVGADKFGYDIYYSHGTAHDEAIVNIG
jgi:hypothetical protein